MDEVALRIEFLETKVRNTDRFECEVRVTEDGSYGTHVTDSWTFISWEQLKEKFPTFKDLMYEFFYSCNWECCGNANDKILSVKSVEGGEGLYDDYNVEVCNLDRE